MDFGCWIAVAAERSHILGGFGSPLVVALGACLVTWLLTPLVSKFAIQKGAVDDPTRDDRRVHTKPIPRWGGLAIFGGIVIPLLIALPLRFPHPFANYLIALFVLGVAVVVMGALDDLYQFPAKIQALFLIAVGIAIQFFFDGAGRVQIKGIMWPPFGQGTWVDFGWVAIPLTAIYIFVVTKTSDTIDGIDGLAAGISTIAAATLSVLATYEGQPRVALVAAAVSGAALGFLRHNYNPARIFMGTGGAQLLGFMLSVLSIVGALKTAAAVAFVVPLLVFGVPIFDAVFVVVRRVLSRQPITQADKRHLHHSLLQKGLNQRQAVWVLYLVAMTLSGILLVVVKLFA